MSQFLELLRHFRVWDAPAWQWLALVALLPTALSLGWGLGGLVLVGLRALAKRTVVTWDDQMVRLMAAPTRLIAAAMIFRVGLRLLSARGAPAELGLALAGALAAAAFGWKLVDFVVGLIESRATHEGADPSAGRGLRTQAKVIGQILHVVVFLVGLALVLVQFDVLRSLGVSLLASAGVAGIVLGIAAQRSIGTLLAGIQLSITRPVRLGDQIVIEGEFGTVEEMTLSYAVVKLWDQRRLVVPITRFLEHPFQNWTRMTPELIGVVLMQVDYSAPIELIRREALAYIAGHPHWNGGTSELRVTDAGERAITLRILASANNATLTGDLRCDIREHMITFLQSLESGAYLPKERFAASEDARPRGRDDDDDPETKLKN
jgi:small-conductance mechanosensitive channel